MRFHIELFMRQEPGALLIEIENSHNGAVRKFGNMFQTTKPKKTGTASD